MIDGGEEDSQLRSSCECTAVSAAFHLIPFLFGVFMAICVIAAAVYLLGFIGAVIAIIVIIAACAGAGHHAG